MMNITSQNSVTPQEVFQEQTLRHQTSAMRLSFTWFGVRRTLSPEQRAEAADAFGAEGNFLSAGKKLIDTRNPAFRAVSAVRNRATSYFRGMSLPFPDPGVRLVRLQDVEAINQRMELFQGELREAVLELDQHFEELKSAARNRLGRLYNPGDYPNTLDSQFDVSWEFVSIDPPSYLLQLSPEIYRQECERTQAKFVEAARLAEFAFLDELSKLVTHLTDRLSGTDDGRPKIFRDTAVSNLTDFFERFRHLNIASSEQLDSLVNQAQQIVRGVEPQQLRDNAAMRQETVTQLAGVQSVLDGLLVDRPRRAILRKLK